MFKNKALPWYTVVLLYPDYATGDYGADIYVEWAQGKDARAAVKKVQKMALKANPEIPAEDFKMIAVFAGQHTAILDATCG